MAAPPRRRIWKLPSSGCIGILVALAFLTLSTPLGFVVTIPAMHIWGTVGTRWEFSRNEAYYERVVELIVRDGLKANEEAHYRIPRDWDQQALERVDRETLLKSFDDDDRLDQRYRWVFAWRDASGALAVPFTTYDWGHAGSHGLLYCSADLTGAQAAAKLPNCGRATLLKRGWWAYARGD